MRIERVSPPPPPREISMSFPVREGWAIVAALNDYVARHPQAVERGQWREWADQLDKELRA